MHLLHGKECKHELTRYFVSSWPEYVIQFWALIANSNHREFGDGSSGELAPNWV